MITLVIVQWWCNSQWKENTQINNKGLTRNRKWSIHCCINFLVITKVFKVSSSLFTKINTSSDIHFTNKISYDCNRIALVTLNLNLTGNFIGYVTKPLVLEELASRKFKWSNDYLLFLRFQNMFISSEMFYGKKICFLDCLHLCSFIFLFFV